MSGATKYDQGKPMMSLLPAQALIEVAKVMTFGAKKYDRDNWRKGFDWSRLADANLRHKFAFLSGERVDPESGLSHLAHGICMDLMLLEHLLCGLGTDDLFKGYITYPNNPAADLLNMGDKLINALEEYKESEDNQEPLEIQT